jgi:hypothetical protein
MIVYPLRFTEYRWDPERTIGVFSSFQAANEFFSDADKTAIQMKWPYSVLYVDEERVRHDGHARPYFQPVSFDKEGNAIGNEYVLTVKEIPDTTHEDPHEEAAPAESAPASHTHPHPSDLRHSEV